MKHKCPAELNSRVVRINVGDWQLLAELSQKLDITMAKALHLLITDQARREQLVTSRTQIPMPLTTAYPATLATAIATNGSKVAAFRIKPRGTRYD